MMSFLEIKPEHLGEEVDGSHDEHLNERVNDFSKICFDYEDPDQDKIPIKEEIKEEIKHEPMDIDNRDDDSHVIDVEKDQEKSYLQSMIDKLLIEKHTLQKDFDKLVELQVENQILKSDKTNLERQLEDKVKELEQKNTDLQVKNQNLRDQLLQLNPIVLLKKIKKSDVAQSLEIPEEEPVGFPSKDMNISDPEVSSNCSDSGANQDAFEELIIPDSNNDNPEGDMKKVKKRHHST